VCSSDDGNAHASVDVATHFCVWWVLKEVLKDLKQSDLVAVLMDKTNSFHMMAVEKYKVEVGKHL
jgi:hypothetical protein